MSEHAKMMAWQLFFLTVCLFVCLFAFSLLADSSFTSKEQGWG